MGNFKHKHCFGQNFLKDKNVLMKMIDSVDVTEDDLIIEIGPGQGALTKYLKLFKAQLLCFEVDIDVKRYLSPLEDDRTQIVFQDILQVDLNNILSRYNYKKLYFIANLPYYITTPIIEKIIDSKIDVCEMVFMVQEEVADRFSAKAGSKSYGAMSVYLSYYYDVEKLFFVSKNCFDPIPKVDSAVIKMVAKSEYPLVDKDELFSLVRDAFHMKRKNLRNNLVAYDLEIVANVLANYNLNLQNRAEDVSFECFVLLAQSLKKSA